MKQLAVVKVGTSSLTTPTGAIDDAALTKLCDDVAAARRDGWHIVLVASGAVAAGLPALGLDHRPSDVGVLQALAAVGQPRLVARIGAQLEPHGIVIGQVLLTPYDFAHRSQYLHARETFERLLELGVLPVVNENDTVADDEIRYGDNDLLAALVANMLRAETLALLTDTRGVFTSDPRLRRPGVARGGDRRVRRARGRRRRQRVRARFGRNGEQAGRREDGRMVRCAGRDRERGRARHRAWCARGAQRRRHRRAGSRGAPVGAQAVDRLRAAGAGSHRRRRRCAARARARRAIVARGRRAFRRGRFDVDAPVEVIDHEGAVFAKGLSRYAAGGLRAVAGLNTSALPEGAPAEVIHRDDLVLLP